MSYPIESRPASKNSWFTPAESNAYYKTRYAREGITVHWWGGGESAGQHDNIVNYFAAQGTQGKKSVNFVVSDNKITQMVDADNVAWCSQAGNPTTISIEFQPTLSAEGYKRGGWLINELEKRYGRTLSLYPHSHWAATSCPGSIDINRLRAEANNFKKGSDDKMIIPDADNWYARMRRLHIQLLGQDLSRADFSRAVAGQEFLHMIEYMSDEWRANDAQAAQELGQRAITEGWAAQIAELKANAAELNQRPTKENFDKLQVALNQCTIDLKEAKQTQAADQQAGDSFLRRVGQFIKKYLP